MKFLKEPVTLKIWQGIILLFMTGVAFGMLLAKLAGAFGF